MLLTAEPSKDPVKLYARWISTPFNPIATPANYVEAWQNEDYFILFGILELPYSHGITIILCDLEMLLELEIGSTLFLRCY